MKYFLIFLQLTLSIPMVLSQENEQLIIQDNTKGKSRVFVENQRIKIWVADEKHKGKFIVESDTTIVIGGESIIIDDITQFRGSTKKGVVTGSLLAGVPSLVIAVSSVLAFQLDDFGFLFIATGGVFTGVVTIPIGVTLIISTKKNCGIDERYSLSIE